MIPVLLHRSWRFHVFFTFVPFAFLRCSLRLLITCVTGWFGCYLTFVRYLVYVTLFTSGRYHATRHVVSRYVVVAHIHVTRYLPTHLRCSVPRAPTWAAHHTYLPPRSPLLPPRTTGSPHLLPHRTSFTLVYLPDSCCLTRFVTLIYRRCCSIHVLTFRVTHTPTYGC